MGRIEALEQRIGRVQEQIRKLAEIADGLAYHQEWSCTREQINDLLGELGTAPCIYVEDEHAAYSYFRNAHESMQDAGSCNGGGV
jgi:hypothetical protein